MRRVRSILAVTILSSKWIVRQPLWIVQSVVFTLGFILIMGVWGGELAVKNIALVLYIISLWSIGMNIASQTIGWNMIGHIDEMYIASPVTLFEYYIGIVLSTMLYYVFFLIPSFILFTYYNLLGIMPVLTVFGVASLIISTCLGTVIVLSIKNPTNISAITNPVTTLFTVLPPVYYPATMLPHPLDKIASYIPTATLMELARWYAGLPTVLTDLEAMVNIAVWIAISLIATSKVVTWGRR